MFLREIRLRIPRKGQVIGLTIPVQRSWILQRKWVVARTIGSSISFPSWIWARCRHTSCRWTTSRRRNQRRCSWGQSLPLAKRRIAKILYRMIGLTRFWRIKARRMIRRWWSRVASTPLIPWTRLSPPPSKRSATWAWPPSCSRTRPVGSAPRVVHLHRVCRCTKSHRRTKVNRNSRIRGGTASPNSCGKSAIIVRTIFLIRISSNTWSAAARRKAPAPTPTPTQTTPSNSIPWSRKLWRKAICLMQMCIKLIRTRCLPRVICMCRRRSHPRIRHYNSRTTIWWISSTIT